MSLSYIKGMPGLEPFVALIQTVVDEVLAESGVAAQNFATLGDKTLADLPTINIPLATALTAKANNATALAHYGDTGNPHATTAAQVGAIPAGGLKTINGSSIVGSGNLVVSGGAGDFASLTDKATVDIPTTNAPLAAALALKVDNLAPVNLGTTGVTLNRTSHGARLSYFSGSTDQTFPLSSVGAVNGDWMELAHAGTGGIMNFTALSAAAGKKTNLTIGETGYVEFFGGAWHSGIDAGSSSTALGVITGVYTTGSLLTFTPANGWAGTYQWLRDGANISGATSATYTLVSADETHTITCKFTPTYYIASGSIASGAADTTPPTVTASIPSTDNTRVNLVFSEGINSTLGLPAKWVTSGHPYTSIVYDGSTSAHLVTSTPFTAGETVVLAYTANGTNDIKDLAATPNLLANFTGKSVTNNLISSTAFSDNGNRADSSSLGSPYSNIPSTSGWSIVSNQFSGPASFGMTGRTYAADGAVQADIVASTSGGLFFRALDANNYMAFNYDGTTVNLFRNVGGSFSIIGSSTADSGFPKTIQAVFSGSSLIVKVGGVTRIAVTDSSNLTEVLVGFIGFGSGNLIDNFSGT